MVTTSLVGHVEAQNKVEQRALAGAARAHNGDALADLQLETEIVENRRCAAFVLKRHAVEGDVIGNARQVGGAGPIGAAGRGIQQFPECVALQPPTGWIPG